MSNSKDSIHSASDLLAYEPFVRSIARGLLSDEGRVRDVVQETWVRALSKPPRAKHSLKSWLGRVTHNLALDAHRRDGRRRSIETLAAREEALREDEHGLELHGHIVEAVLALDEPYKSVVILRYFRDLSHAKIARRLDRKEATVRSQLHRAHELLKSKLDADYGGERRAWLVLCAPLSRGNLAAGSGALFAKVAAAVLVVGLGVSGAASALSPNPGEASLVGLDPGVGAADLPQVAKAPGAPRAAGVPASVARTSLTSSILVLQNGAALEGADVWCVILSDVDEDAVRRQPGISSDSQEFFGQFGVHSVTDAKGRASLPEADSDFAVLVARGNQLRLLQIHETKAQPLVAELQRVAMVRVRAVDAQGQPLLGIPIVLRSTQRSGAGGLGSTSRDVLTHITRGPSAEALFRGFQIGMQAGAPRTWTVRLGVPGVHSRQTVLDLESDGLETLDLELEATAPLVLRSCNADGSPRSLQGTARLRSTGLEQATLDVPLVDGIARYPFVGIGKPLEATLLIPSLGARWTVNASGPKSGEEPATVDILDPRAPRLRGRVVDTEGEPLVRTRFHVTLFDGNQRRVRNTEVDTDAAGVFFLETDASSSALFVTLLHYGDRGLDGRAELSEAVALTPPLTDLGDLEYIEAQGWVEGRCVGPDGQGLAGISLVLDQRPGFGKSMGTTRATGEFFLGGVFDEELQLRVEPGPEWVLERPLMVRRGQRDVRMVLAAGASVAGALRVDEGVSMGDVRVRLRAALAEGCPGPWRAVALAPTGQFQARGLLAGAYELEFGMHGTVVTLLRGVNVAAGEAARDERLAHVDLRGKLRKREFAVRDEQGKPLAGARAAVSQAGGTLAEASANEAGTIELWCPTSPGELIRVGAPGYRDAFLEADAQVAQLSLRTGIAVELTSSTRLELKRSGKAHFLSLVLEETDARKTAFVTRVALPSSLATSGEAQVLFPAPGRYRLHHALHYDMHALPGTASVGGTPVAGDFVIDVPEGLQSITIPLQLPAQLP